MQEKIKAIVAEIKQDDTWLEKLTPQTDLIHEVGLDSLQMVDFLLQVESNFSVEIDFDEIDFSHLSSISSFCSFLEEQQK